MTERNQGRARLTLLQGGASGASPAPRADELGASELARLEALLQPAPAEMTEKAVLLVLRPYGLSPCDEEVRIKAYAVALEGLCETALHAGVRDVLQGKVQELDPRDPPAPGQLARICRQHEERIVAKLDRLRAGAQAPERPAPEQSPQDRAEIAERLEVLAQEIRRNVAALEMKRALKEEDRKEED